MRFTPLPPLSLILVHAIPLALAVVLFGPTPLALLWCAPLPIIVLLTLRWGGRDQRRVCALLSGCYALLSCFLYASFYMQGTGFTEEFFFHLQPSTIPVALTAYGQGIAVLVFLVVAALVVPLFLDYPAEHARRPLSVVALWLVVIIVSYPAYSLAAFVKARSDYSNSDAWHSFQDLPEMDAYARTLLRTATPARRKNLILIYAESLESVYFQDDFNDEYLLPRLRALSEEALVFSGLRQVAGTGATVAGIVASQCGFPVQRSSVLSINSIFAVVEDPYADQRCLGDILKDAGYRTMFVGGADLDFAGKGKFLRSHGFLELYGREELKTELPQISRLHKWGFYDEDMLAFARDKLVEMEASGEPYFLSVLTVDTHHPEGFRSPSCVMLPESREPMRNALYCADQLLAAFIRELRETVDPSNTVIALFSDHLSMRNTLWDMLKARAGKRRLTFHLFSDKRSGRVNVAGTHFDVAPTLLESMGFVSQLAVGNGLSLFFKEYLEDEGHEVPTVQASDAPRIRIEAPSIDSTPLQLGFVTREIGIGDRRFPISADGMPFQSGIFLVVFDEEGYPVDTVFTYEYSALVKRINGRFVVGISVFEDKPVPSYFYGRITPSGDRIVQRGFYRDTTLSPDLLLEARRPLDEG